MRKTDQVSQDFAQVFPNRPLLTKLDPGYAIHSSIAAVFSVPIAGFSSGQPAFYLAKFQIPSRLLPFSSLGISNLTSFKAPLATFERLKFSFSSASLRSASGKGRLFWWGRRAEKGSVFFRLAIQKLGRIQKSLVLQSAPFPVIFGIFCNPNLTSFTTILLFSHCLTGLT